MEALLKIVTIIFAYLVAIICCISFILALVLGIIDMFKNRQFKKMIKEEILKAFDKSTDLTDENK